jgi:hypothetical protein
MTLTRRRIAVLGVVAALGILATSVYAGYAGDEWTWGDWYGGVVGLILFLVGIVLSFGQGDIQREQHQLQRALGDLELREKITCFHAHGAELYRAPDTVERAFGLIGDARAALPVFSHAREGLQREFLHAFAENIRFVRDIHDPEVARRLATLAGELAREIARAPCPEDCRQEREAAIGALAHIAAR